MTTALYRRYRPETFAEVIGQDHVTAPLRQALRSGRVNHAYLFSGPRGCGKTTSARILARTLNCARNTDENPLDTPCGECESCVELARGGPGSLDVVEIDAASHNGVDDARDLRERASFAPARDRFKIFVLDEAHMVTPQGFNALLKIVEEPPPHVKFVFATTEPDKVIGTIRSRTHHYPFRLVPPDVLGPYLEQLCGAEGVALGAGVVPLVTRAGGGSVRDSLSVLDQLIAGATGGTVEYDTAVGLLGFTHATLLDDVVDALAARDGGSIFRVVDQIIATGHEPRRFVEDVLERLRDLIVIAVSGESADAVLRDLPADQLDRMRHQAANLGVAELSRAADLVNSALTEMTGATSPRLHLELLCARLLLPGADDGTDGLAARIDRLERGAVAAGSAAGASVAVAAPGPGTAAVPPAAAAAPVTSGAAGGGAPEEDAGLSGLAAARAAMQAARRPVRHDVGTVAAPQATEAAPTEPAPAPAEPDPAPAAEPAAASEPDAASGAVAPATSDPEPRDPEPAADEVEPAPAPEPGPGPDPAPETAPEPVAEPAPESVAEPEPEPATAPPSEPAPAPEPAPQPETAAATEAAPGLTAEEVRRRWDEVVANVASPVTRALVGPNAQVASLSGDLLRLGFQAEGMARTFSQPRHVDGVADAVYQTLGIQVRVEATVGAPGPEEAPRTVAPPAPEPDAEPQPAHSAQTAPSASTAPAAPSAPPAPRSSTGSAVPGDTAPGGAAPGVGGHPSGGEPGGWPTVVPPGAAPSGPQGGPSAPVGADRGTLASASASGPTPSGPGGGVAVAERVGTATAMASESATEAVEPATDAADAADAAWLAGSSASADAAPTSSSAATETAPAPAAAPGSAGTPPRPDPGAAVPSSDRGAERAPDGRPDRTPGATAYERFQRERPAAPSGPAEEPPPIDHYADASDDDPELVSSGLVGVPLVVKLLDGKILEEVADQP